MNSSEHQQCTETSLQKISSNDTSESLTGPISYQPHLFGIIFFIVTYILITDPVYKCLLTCSYNNCWTRLTIAVIIAGLAFFTVAYSIAPLPPIDPPQ